MDKWVWSYLEDLCTANLRQRETDNRRKPQSQGHRQALISRICPRSRLLFLPEGAERDPFVDFGVSRYGSISNLLTYPWPIEGDLDNGHASHELDLRAS